jgi:hypothetical protein
MQSMFDVGNQLGQTALESYGGSRLAVRYSPIAALRLDPQNPRLHSRKQVRQIAKSIASFGFNVPVLVDAEQSVIAGHGRVLAAKELGWDEVPVIALEHSADGKRSLGRPAVGRTAQRAFDPQSQLRSRGNGF